MSMPIKQDRNHNTLKLVSFNANISIKKAVTIQTNTFNIVIILIFHTKSTFKSFEQSKKRKLIQFSKKRNTKRICKYCQENFERKIQESRREMEIFIAFPGAKQEEEKNFHPKKASPTNFFYML